MVDNKKKRLKTGLDILLGTENSKVSKEVDDKNLGNLALNIRDIKPNLQQPRSYFDKNSIEELAGSIREQGLLMPILVKRDLTAVLAASPDVLYVVIYLYLINFRYCLQDDLKTL